jgi:hypothetical protein
VAFALSYHDRQRLKRRLTFYIHIAQNGTALPDIWQKIPPAARK